MIIISWSYLPSSRGRQLSRQRSPPDTIPVHTLTSDVIYILTMTLILESPCTWYLHLLLAAPSPASVLIIWNNTISEIWSCCHFIWKNEIWHSPGFIVCRWNQLTWTEKDENDCWDFKFHPQFLISLKLRIKMRNIYLSKLYRDCCKTTNPKFVFKYWNWMKC